MASWSSAYCWELPPEPGALSRPWMVLGSGEREEPQPLLRGLSGALGLCSGERRKYTQPRGAGWCCTTPVPQLTYLSAQPTRGPRVPTVTPESKTDVLPEMAELGC